MSLTEVVVVVVLIAVLAAVSLPMLSRANGKARSTACRANLMTLGILLDRYDNGHGQLPALMNRTDRSLDVPTLDQALALSERDRASLRCPADDTGAYERTGTSYRWFAAWDRLSLRGDGPWPVTPLVADKAPFHRDEPLGYNALFPQPAPTQRPLPLHASPYAMPE